MTRKPLRLLLIEDSDLDAAHLLLELKRGGFEPEVTRVETRDELQDALFEKSFDAIISDYHLPRFSAPEALDIVRGSRIDVPFIVVSGAIGEETAAELMRAGAHDYLLKHRLTRLGVAVDRELEQALARRDKRRAESLFQSVLRGSPVPAALIDMATRRVVDGSDTFRRQFIEGSEYRVDRGLFDLIRFTHPERIEQLLARGSGTAWYTVYYANGVTRMANVRCYTVEHEGTSYAYMTMEDVTEQHYLKAAFDAVPDPLLILSSTRTLLYANRAAEEVFGNLYFGMDVRPFLRQEGEEDAWWSRLDRFEEKRVEIAAQPYDATAVPFRFAGEGETSTILTLHNATSEEELRRLATHDALTGVFNMRHFNEVLSSELAEGGTLALLDLDYFKPINDELGHAAGDAALMTFATLVRNELDESAVFARIGGDEFAIFFPRAPIDDAVHVVQSIYARMAATPFRFNGATRRFSASFGLAASERGDSLETLKRRADEALYEAKRQGRGRFVVSSPSSSAARSESPASA
ncbi:MAG TPA: diguanylate cyclase, partial [Thermoanaerobaculia bacterium]|jgi:diguanylate cyclase (GGDEF)-like protein|nr:diguanylate cyclase [Thermoanaerobaculia bacterium]